MNNVKPTLCLKKISKSFKQGSQNLEVLKGVDLEIMPGEIVALIGPSGSGKSTLLQIAGLLDRPSKGEITLDEMKCGKLGDGMRTGHCAAIISVSFINIIICLLILTRPKT